MGKRTTRIYHHQIATQLTTLLQATAHVILWKGQTYFGTIVSYTADSLTVEDKGTFWYNRERHTHTILLADIREVITERQSAE